MTHCSDADLVLLAYGEAADTVATHVASCAACHARLSRLEGARVAGEWATTRGRRRVARWAAVGLLATAAVVAVVLVGRPPAPERAPQWPRSLEWSATAGYLAGGKAVITIDAQLTQLEQGWSYVRP
jgi:hypothetical protein